MRIVVDNDRDVDMTMLVDRGEVIFFDNNSDIVISDRLGDAREQVRLLVSWQGDHCNSNLRRMWRMFVHLIWLNVDIFGI